MDDPEIKWRDNVIVFSGDLTAGAIAPNLVFIAEGDSKLQRIGREVTILHMELRYDVELPESHLATRPKKGDVARMIIYVDKQCNGASALITDVLLLASYLSPYNVENEDRFVILYDHSTDANYGGLTSNPLMTQFDQSAVIKHYEMQMNLNIPIDYSGVAGFTSQITSNIMGMIVLTRFADTNISGWLRLRFVG